MTLSKADKDWITERFAKKAHGHADLDARLDGAESQLTVLDGRLDKLEEPVKPPEPPAPEEPPPPSSAFLAVPSGATKIFDDDCKVADPIPKWAAVCAQRDDGAPDRLTYNFSEIIADRIIHYASGGPESNGAFRRYSANNGDQMWQQRSQAGKNWHDSPTAMFKAEQRYIAHIWVRFGPEFDPDQGSAFAHIFQTKQAQPYQTSNPGQAFELQCFGGYWDASVFWNDATKLRFPITAAERGRSWVPVSLDIFCSPNASRGKLALKIGEREPMTISEANMLVESSPGGGAYPPGSPITNQLQAGIYTKTGQPRRNIDVGPVRVWRV